MEIYRKSGFLFAHWIIVIILSCYYHMLWLEKMST